MLASHLFPAVETARKPESACKVPHIVRLSRCGGLLLELGRCSSPQGPFIAPVDTFFGLAPDLFQEGLNLVATEAYLLWQPPPSGRPGHGCRPYVQPSIRHPKTPLLVPLPGRHKRRRRAGVAIRRAAALPGICRTALRLLATQRDEQVRCDYALPLIPKEAEGIYRTALRLLAPQRGEQVTI